MNESPDHGPTADPDLEHRDDGENAPSQPMHYPIAQPLILSILDRFAPLTGELLSRTEEIDKENFQPFSES